MIRAATGDDAAAIASIYNHYIDATIITFEETRLSGAEVAARIEKITAGYPWLVAERDGRVVGYAYAGPFHARSAYRYTAETAIYLEHGLAGQGIGSALYERLLAELRERGFRMALGGIALPNPASVALHERFGFVRVAGFFEVGFKLDRWIDVGYWQLRL